jgi:hypothetical protein
MLTFVCSRRPVRDLGSSAAEEENAHAARNGEFKKKMLQNY